MLYYNFGNLASINEALDNFALVAKMQEGLLRLAQLPTLTYQYNLRELVYQYKKIKLYHYAAKVKKISSIPLLVVFATVNRPEILDLFPETSLIGGLLNQGIDVYLLDWGYPDHEDQAVSLNDYVADYLHHCVQHTLKRHGLREINLLGVCQGGLICLGYTLLFKQIKNLILISTPINFNTSDNVIAKIFKKLDVETFVHLVKNIPGAWLTQFFIQLRPFELVGKKYLRFMDHLENSEWTDKFLRVEKWLYDAPDQTGASFTELIQDFYAENKLIKGMWYLGGKHVDLASLTIPLLNIMAEEDEIIPISASEDLQKYISSNDYTQLFFPSGHIGIYISEKVGSHLSQAIGAWLKERESKSSY